MFGMVQRFNTSIVVGGRLLLLLLLLLFGMCVLCASLVSLLLLLVSFRGVSSLLPYRSIKSLYEYKGCCCCIVFLSLFVFKLCLACKSDNNNDARNDGRVGVSSPVLCVVV